MTSTVLDPVTPDTPTTHDTAAHPASARTASGRIPLTRVIAVELRKMFDTRSGFWLMASIVITSVLATAALIVFAPDDQLTFDNFAAAIGAPMTVILPMIAILAVTSEWSQRSGLTTFTLVPHRGRVLGAKLVAAVAVGIVAMVVGAVSFLLIVLWLLPATQGSGGFADAYGPTGPADALRILADGAERARVGGVEAGELGPGRHQVGPGEGDLHPDAGGQPLRGEHRRGCLPPGRDPGRAREVAAVPQVDRCAEQLDLVRHLIALVEAGLQQGVCVEALDRKHESCILVGVQLNSHAVQTAVDQS